jgi:hypothetical protein
MAAQIIIPKDKKQAETAIDTLIRTGKRYRNPNAIRWWIAYWYMRGARNFTNINYQEGTIQVSYVDESGFLKFQYEEIVSKYQTQLGRLMSLDLSPAVKRKGISLDGLRKSSIAQVALDAAFPQDKVDTLKQALLPTLLMYGTVGLCLWIEDENSMGIDVAPPWELLPIPGNISHRPGIKGLMRSRNVPLDWVKNLVITPGGRSDTYDEIAKAEMPV